MNSSAPISRLVRPRAISRTTTISRADSDGSDLPDSGAGAVKWRSSRTADLVERYRDLPLGSVDASVIACAERLGVDQVATVDRRHFTVVKANRQLALLP